MSDIQFTVDEKMEVVNALGLLISKFVITDEHKKEDLKTLLVATDRLQQIMGSLKAEIYK